MRPAGHTRGSELPRDHGSAFLASSEESSLFSRTEQMFTDHPPWARGCSGYRDPKAKGGVPGSEACPLPCALVCLGTTLLIRLFRLLLSSLSTQGVSLLPASLCELLPPVNLFLVVLISLFFLKTLLLVNSFNCIFFPFLMDTVHLFQTQAKECGPQLR